MSDVCATLKIVREDSPGGFCIINEADFKDGDVLYGVEPNKAPVKRASEMTVEEIKSATATATHDELIELYNDEIANKSRVKAVEALEAAIEELEAADKE